MSGYYSIFYSIFYLVAGAFFAVASLSGAIAAMKAGKVYRFLVGMGIIFLVLAVFFSILAIKGG